MRSVLIVDDVPAMSEQYAYDLQRLADYETHIAGSGEEALRLLKTEFIDCVLLDLEMPGMDGFAVLEEIHRRGYTIPVIVYTGTGSYERCVRAVKLGAVSFLDKSESMEKVVQEIEGAVERTRLQGEVRELRRQLGETGDLLGESKVMQALRERIGKIAPVPSPVLIQGESGSGKEVVAREIHARSGRGKAPFLPVNCAALPENLVESELFGHEKGAFTGAAGTHRGAFEAAHRGTLFLDEIGELPLPAQAVLLRVLEDNQVTRVGGTRQIAVDVRVVAATNRDLEMEVSEKRFRQDLFYRLNVHALEVPPLRARLGDVPILVKHFLGTISERFGRGPLAMSDEALESLMAYGWERNNVRELRNIVERMVIAADGSKIGADAVPSEIRNAPPAAGRTDQGPGLTMKEQKARAEREILLEALNRNHWQITRTAAELGLADHSSLLKIMRRHGIRKG